MDKVESAKARVPRRSCWLFVAVLRRVIQAYSVCIVIVAALTVPACFVGACLFAGPGLGDYGFPLPGNLEFSRSSAYCRCILAGGSAVVPPDITQIAWDDRHIVCYNGGQASVVGWWIVQVEPLRVFGPLSDEDCRKQRDRLHVAPGVVAAPVSEFGRDGVRTGE